VNILAFLCAALIGVVLGALGGGGSILTVPVFVYVLHFDPKLAIAMSLPVVGITSVVGAFGHWREGHIDAGAALAFGALAMAGAYTGARLAAFVSGTTQLILLGIVMAAAAISMLRSARGKRSCAVETGPAQPPRRSLLIVATLACAIGALTGLIGIGGGFLFVPALVLLARMPMKLAIGTSLAVIAMNSAAGFAGYAGRVSIPWDVVAVFIAVSSGGILAGVYLVRLIEQSTLRRAFGVFLLIVAGWMLYQNLASPRRVSEMRGSPGGSGWHH
jgi:uncharacterized membrane protein YfcA